MSGEEHSRRLNNVLKSAHNAVIDSVSIHGWWELYTKEEIWAVVRSEMAKVEKAIVGNDASLYQSEAEDCIVALSKGILRLRSLAEEETL